MPSEEDMRERLCLRYLAKAPLIEEGDIPAHGTPQMGSDSPDEDHLDIWKVRQKFHHSLHSYSFMIPVYPLRFSFYMVLPSTYTSVTFYYV